MFNKKREWQKALEIKIKHEVAMHMELGAFYEIPECCIFQFCAEVPKGIPSGMKRQQDFPGKYIDPMLGYVPCNNCMSKL